MKIEDVIDQPCSVETVAEVRQRVIDSGKHFYTTKEHLLRSARSIAIHDAVFLAKLIGLVNPKTVIEIGTWFGTSAAVMESVNHCKIYTCDKQNVYSVTNKNIVFYNLLSDQFLKKIIKKEISADLCFIDANLRPGDAEMLVKIIKGVFIVHDYIKGEKGDRAVSYLIGTGKKFNVLPYNGVAVLEYV